MPRARAASRCAWKLSAPNWKKSASGGASASALVPSFLLVGRDHAGRVSPIAGAQGRDVIGRDIRQVARQHHDGARAALGGETAAEAERGVEAVTGSSSTCRPWPRISASRSGSAVTTTNRGRTGRAEHGVEHAAEQLAIEGGALSAPSSAASRDLPARNGLTGMIAQQSILSSPVRQTIPEANSSASCARRALVVERAHHGIADTHPIAKPSIAGRGPIDVSMIQPSTSRP